MMNKDTEKNIGGSVYKSTLGTCLPTQYCAVLYPASLIILMARCHGATLQNVHALAFREVVLAGIGVLRIALHEGLAVCEYRSQW